MSLTRGQLAKQTGCNSETILYFEKIGLLPEPERSPTGYRLYTTQHLRRLSFIQRAKSLGFSSQRVRQLLELSDEGDQRTRSDVKNLTEEHIREVTEKIRDLEKLKRNLLEISSHCDGSHTSASTCPILDSLFTS